MKASRGYILIISLLFMSVLSLFVLSFMGSVSLMLKVNHQWVKKHADFFALEKVVDLIRSQWREVPAHCFVQDLDENESVTQLFQKKGCETVSQGARVYYLMSDEGMRGSQHEWGITAFEAHGYVIQERFATMDSQSESIVLSFRYWLMNKSGLNS